jgi:hypothetical protein
MGKYIIAGLKTEFEANYKYLKNRAKEYEADFDSSETDIKIEFSDEFFAEKMKEITTMTIEGHEYFWTAQRFNSMLMDVGGIMLHSSCVEKDGYAYLFSADSGTGKSTHTHIWLKVFPEARIINDDKPALIKEDGIWYACGTPFSGKTPENINVKVPVRAITFIKRGLENKIERLSTNEAIKLVFGQIIRTKYEDRAFKTLEVVDSILKNIPVFSLECNMDDDAAITAYNGIERLINDEN